MTTFLIIILVILGILVAGCIIALIHMALMFCERYEDFCTKYDVVRNTHNNGKIDYAVKENCFFGCPFFWTTMSTYETIEEAYEKRDELDKEKMERKGKRICRSKSVR